MTPKVIEVDDILEGYNNVSKVRNVYFKLREGVLQAEPIQRSPGGLVTAGHHHVGSGSYEWELFNIEDGQVMLEAWGSWTGYAHHSKRQPKISDDERNFHDGRICHWHGMRLTLYSSHPELKKRIEKIVSQFPRSAREKVS